MTNQQKSAFIAVAGRPSAGKSTLLNTLCGSKVSIVSPVPQTTRNSIRGIVTRPCGQLVFVDTPGLHLSGKKLNTKLQKAAERSLAGADLTLYLLDAARAPGPEEAAAAALITALHTGYADRTFAVINKIDLKKADCGVIETFLAEKMSALKKERIFHVSALTGEGVETMLEAIFDAAPEGPPWYDHGCYTDQDVRFRIAEIIREQCIHNLREELPHCVYVDIEDAELRSPSRLWVRAVIYAERESQKGMIVGKDGRLIRKIRLGALKELRAIFDWTIDLDMRVKVSRDWRQNDAVLNTLV